MLRGPPTAQLSAVDVDPKVALPHADPSRGIGNREPKVSTRYVLDRFDGFEPVPAEAVEPPGQFDLGATLAHGFRPSSIALSAATSAA